MVAGYDAISEIDLFDLGGMSCTRGGVIRNYTSPFINGKASFDRAAIFAIGAASEALGLSDQPTSPDKKHSAADIGIITATNFASIASGEAALADIAHADARACLNCAQQTVLHEIADTLQLGGLRIALSLSCASGAAALAYGASLIRRGQAKRMLVVAFDAISRFAWSGLCCLRTMTKGHVQPFDLNRSGTIFSEGAAALLLEGAKTHDACRQKPLAEITGWATNNNGFHLTAPAPRGRGSFLVMRDAIKLSGIAPDQIDHINAHGTATKPNDLTESQAFYDLFGERAATIPVTSIKSSIGHMLGAAGAIEAIASIKTLQTGIIPPTIHFETPDPECPVKLVANKPQEGEFSYVLSNSAGIGGCNSAIVFAKP